MGVNRRTLAALVCALLATAAVASAAAASHATTPGVTKSRSRSAARSRSPGRRRSTRRSRRPSRRTSPTSTRTAASTAARSTSRHSTTRTTRRRRCRSTKKLVEQDHVFAIVREPRHRAGPRHVGVPEPAQGPAGARSRPATAYWGSASTRHAQSRYPWTTGWQPDYPGEAKVYAQVHPQQQAGGEDRRALPERRLRQELLHGLRTASARTRSEIVDAESYDVSDSAQVDRGSTSRS